MSAQRTLILPRSERPGPDTDAAEPPFWRTTVARLTLLHRGMDDHDRYEIYGIQCPHGQRAVKRYLPSELGPGLNRDYDRLQQFHDWTVRAIQTFRCDCSAFARQATFREFIAATSDWLLDV